MPTAPPMNSQFKAMISITLQNAIVARAKKWPLSPNRKVTNPKASATSAAKNPPASIPNQGEIPRRANKREDV